MEFDPELLLSKWKTYASKIQLAGKLSLYSALTKHPIQLKDQWVIELLIENKAQEEEVKSELVDLLGFLRKELRNYKIQLATIINTDDTIKKAYTPQEKFNKMVEKNPQLKDLMDKLDLEAGY